MGVFSTELHRFAVGALVDVLIRPDDIVPDPTSPLQAKVLNRAFRGAHMLYQLELAGQRLSCLAPSHHQHQLGETIGIRPDLADLVLFARPGG